MRVEWLRDWPFKQVIFPFQQQQQQHLWAYFPWVDGITDYNIDYVKVKENCAYRHFAFFKSYEVPNKFALKFYKTWNLYLFCFTCLVLNIQHGDVTENVWQMILKFLTFSTVGCHFIFQTHKKVFSQMFYDQIIVLCWNVKRELYFTQTGRWINKIHTVIVKNLKSLKKL